MSELQQLAELVKTSDPLSVLAEVKHILRLISKDGNFSVLDAAYGDVRRLFDGAYPGYKKCNTQYHDIKHTTDVFLAMSRLIHGAFVEGEKFTDDGIRLGLVVSLFHDSGYVQEFDDTEGTGAKYTAHHVQRSIQFLEKYFKEKGFSDHDFRVAKAILQCTGLTTDISSIEFETGEIELLGKMLGTADLLGQMADRFYLEKLLFLFHEFREANIGGYESEFDLLRKTIGFFEMTEKRLMNEFDSVDRFMRPHFRARWNMDKDLYNLAVQNNIDYLQSIIEDHDDDYRDLLRRGGIVEKLEQARGGQ
jgi:hypothetical protein